MTNADAQRRRRLFERGAGLAEYALLLLLISVAVFGTLQTLGTDLSTTFSNVSTTLFN